MSSLRESSNIGMILGVSDSERNEVPARRKSLPSDVRSHCHQGSSQLAVALCDVHTSSYTSYTSLGSGLAGSK